MLDHELVMTGFIGKEEIEIEEHDEHTHEDFHFFLFTHWNFHCEYNGPYVISCRITTDYSKRKELKYGENMRVQFTYSLEWQQTDVSINDRLIYHVRKLIHSQPLDVHWLSILNSFILVVLVTAFVALVFMRILKQDCARYTAIKSQNIPSNDLNLSLQGTYHSSLFYFFFIFFCFSLCVL